MTKYGPQGKLVHTQAGVFAAPKKPLVVKTPKRKVKVTRENPTRSGYELGLVMNKRQEFGSYTWAKAVAISKKEQGENRLRTEITVYGWGDDGKRDDRFLQEFTGDGTKEAIAYAKEVVAEGFLHSARVMGVASRIFAQRGFGDRAVFDIAMVELE